MVFRGRSLGAWSCHGSCGLRCWFPDAVSVSGFNNRKEFSAK